MMHYEVNDSSQLSSSSDELFRALFYQAAVGVAQVSLGGEWLLINEKFCEILGYGREELKTKTFQDLTHPSDLEPDIALARQLLAGSIPSYTMEKRYIRKDQTIVWVSLHASLVRDANGPKYFVAVATDITAQKQSEQKLRYHLGLNQTINRKLAEAIFLMSGTGRITFCNPAAEQMFGWSQAELLGRSLPETLYPHRPDGSVYPAFASPLNQVFLQRQKVRNHEDCFLHRNGSWVAVSCSSSPIDDGEEDTFAILVVHDVTKRKEAESAFRDSQDRLLLAQNAAGIGVWEWNLDSNRISWTPEVFGLFGRRLEEGQPTLEECWSYVHPADRDAVEKILHSASKTRTFQGEFRIVRKDGTVRWLENRGQFFESELNRPKRLVGVSVDITERKRTEELLRQKQKLESLGLLAGGIAHDFNNVLTGMLGASTIVLDMLTSDDPVRPLLEGVVQGGERAAGLIKQMLDYSGRNRVEAKPVNLSVVVRDALSLVRHAISKNVEFRFNLEDNAPRVAGDEDQIEQVIMNILINAAQAISNDSGCVKISTETVRLYQQDALALDLEPGWFVKLEIEDTGCGMDERTLERIFDPFFTTKQSGHGLGLASALGIIRSHKGAIRVRSKVGEGTCFQVFLPAVAAREETIIAAEPQLSGTLQFTVLVVDDEDMIREVARAILESYGHKVFLANGAEAAFRVLRDNPGEIQIVLLDLSMPGLGGMDALPQLLALEPGLRVIVSSGFSENQALRDCEEQPAVSFLQKPYTSARLLTALVASVATDVPKAAGAH